MYRSLLHLSWIDKLVDNIKTIFVDLYGDQLKKPHTTLVECHFDEYFDQQIRELEKVTLSQETRAVELNPKYEEVPPGTPDGFKDDAPPLPGLLSRGMHLLPLKVLGYAYFMQDNLRIPAKTLPQTNPLPLEHRIPQDRALLQVIY